MNIKVINKSNHRLPEYATEGSSGMDLKANIDNEIKLKPLERICIPTGIYLEIPKGYEGQIRSRSGNALKYGLFVLNSPATIDSDYRGEIKVILCNLSQEDYMIKPGERIAQIVFTKFEHCTFKEVSEFSQTERGQNGFGHSGQF